MRDFEARTLVGAALCLLCALPVQVGAQAPLLVGAVGDAKVRVDGQLGDWRGLHFASLGDSDDSRLEYAFGYDASALYVGVRVRDDQLVRTRAPSPREDAVVLTLAMPRAQKRPRASEIWLFAGIPGEQAAVAALGRVGAQPERAQAIAIVEGPLPDGDAGYVLEARVPWSALPGGAEFLVARGAIRLHDVDGRAGARPQVVASARAARAADLPPLLCEAGPNAAIRDFLRAKGLGRENVRHDLFADVMGGARLERVVVAGTMVALVGPEVEGGSGFQYQDLPVAMAAGVRSAALRDLSGDGKAELVLSLRLSNEAEARESPFVLDWSSGRARRASELEQQLAQADGDARAAGAQRAPERASVQSSARPQSRREPQPARVVHAQPPGVAELVADFRKARAIDPSLRPRFAQHANVAEDARVESLMLFGADLLVLGKGYRGGSGYFYFSLPVSDGADVQRMFTGDVTGDGRRELFVRMKQRIDDVQREILLAYSFTQAGAEPIASIEVRRAQGPRSVGNVVALVPHAGHWSLRIAPGTAHGWDAQTYPFVAESLDGHRPLLLPWKDRTVRYRFDGRELVPEPLRRR